MLMRLSLWAQICQWTLCQGWGSLQCVTKEHPGQYSLCGPVLSDQTAITRMEAVTATGSRRTRAGAGLTIPTPGETIQSSVLLLSATRIYNLQTILWFPLWKVSLCLSFPVPWAAVKPQPALYKDATDVLWLTMSEEVGQRPQYNGVRDPGRADRTS